MAAAVREAATVAAEPLSHRTWEHVDCTITSTHRPPLALAIDGCQALRVYFDGGCQKGLGPAGALVFSTEGQLLKAEARFHGASAPTNNQAEA